MPVYWRVGKRVMLKRLRRLIKPLAGLLGLTAALAPAALMAIADPDSPGASITSAYAYSGVRETGDLLLIVRYDLPYATTPTVPVSDAYVGRFLRGTSELNSVEPFPFNDRGYGNGIFSLYWTNSQRTTDSIEFSNTNSENYIVGLTGKAGQFPGTVPSASTTAILWRDSTRTVPLLTQDILQLGQDLENNTEWRTPTIQLLLTSITGTATLTSTGENFFSSAVPNLQTMVPDIFSSAAQSPEVFARTFQKSYKANLDNIWTGNWVRTRFQNLADTLQVPRSFLEGLAVFVLMAVVAIAVAKVTADTHHGLELGLMSMAATLPLFTAAGMISMTVTMVVALLAVLGISWTFFLRRAG